MFGGPVTLRIVALGTAMWFAAAPAWCEMIAPSDTCGDCHKDIYAMWRESAHAQSMERPRFLTSYRQVESARGASAAAVCLTCHAPLARAIGDPQLKQKVTWEGVTCDYCHSIVSVSTSSGRPEHRVRIGSVKLGPIEDAESTGHDVEFSPLHEDSAVCAPCHEYVNPNGTAILTTYSEWRDSTAARRGETCQACHMGVTEANVVDPRIKRNPRAEVNLHRMPGGHSQEQLHRALKVSIETQRKDEWLELTVRVKNRGAGHAVPTGMPGRRIILVATVDTYAGESFEERRTYGKQFMHAGGEIVTNVADYFTKEVRLQSDTRIAVDEEKVESFRFPLPAAIAADVVVKLHYEHAVQEGAEDREWLTFLSERRWLEPVPAPESAE
jgi:hypothetical protein